MRDEKQEGPSTPISDTPGATNNTPGADSSTQGPSPSGPKPQPPSNEKKPADTNAPGDPEWKKQQDRMMKLLEALGKVAGAAGVVVIIIVNDEKKELQDYLNNKKENPGQSKEDSKELASAVQQASQQIDEAAKTKEAVKGELSKMDDEDTKELAVLNEKSNSNGSSMSALSDTKSDSNLKNNLDSTFPKIEPSGTSKPSPEGDNENTKTNSMQRMEEENPRCRTK
jgi:hypothetical protein